MEDKKCVIHHLPPLYCQHCSDYHRERYRTVIRKLLHILPDPEEFHEVREIMKEFDISPDFLK